MKLRKQSKKDTERTALTRENNVQNLRKRNGFLKKNLKDRRSKSGTVKQTVSFPLRHKLNRKSGGKQQLNPKSLWTAKEKWLPIQGQPR